MFRLSDRPPARSLRQQTILHGKTSLRLIQELNVLKLTLTRQLLVAITVLRKSHKSMEFLA